MSDRQPTPPIDSQACDQIIDKIVNDAAENRDVAIDALLNTVYSQLRQTAENLMHRERPDHTLSATALVHDAYVRLVGPRDLPWQSRAHFGF